MKIIILMSTVLSLAGSKSLADTWWLTIADNSAKSSGSDWSSPLVSLKDCEAARKRLTGAISRGKGTLGINQFICVEGR